MSETESGFTDSPITTAEYRARIARVTQRIADAARAAGRDPEEIRLLPVSKTVAAEQVRLAVAAGATWLGENKVQEAKAKAEALRDTPARWAIIGHLQTNKARQIVDFAAEFHALDSARLAAELDRRCAAAGRTLEVYVQVNTSGEASKFGLPPTEAVRFVDSLATYPALRPVGLMTLALPSADPAAVRHCFAQLRELREAVHAAGAAQPDQFRHLSMGMSGDFELAIAEGATIVRVGQAIFGARHYPRAGG